MRIGWLWLLAACGDNRSQPPDAAMRPPTYFRDVAPILGARCGACHVDGGVAPFPLATYDDAASRSTQIATVTTARTMPPWPADASGACNSFVDARWLSDQEIETLARWDALGTPAGDPADLVAIEPPGLIPFAEAVALGSPTPYVVRPGPDEYRCFIVDPALTADRFITAVAMHLDRAEVVHHMQLFAADTLEAEEELDELDAADPEPGYACGNEGLGTRLRYVGVWAPGDLVRRWPGDSGIQLHAGHRLVVQLHYHNHDSAPVIDQTQVGLELADTVEHAGTISGLSGYPLTLPPHQPEVTVTAASGLTSSGVFRGARIHMHELGTHARLELVHHGEPQCVLDIPRWAFDWQLFYRFAQPVAFEDGDVLRVSCSYNTETRDAPVTWGLGTDDEMCIGYLFETR